ncbi:MAG: glycosyltransferase family 4 protein [Clostridia bacterium]|nr:glycosyltransferase family 4 protein [Clostridia bacterium]
MKILITTDLYSTATNGVVTSVKNLSEELTGKGHDVRILTLSGNVRSRREGSVYYIRSMPIGVYPNVRMPLSYRHKLIRELIEWKPDVIHSQCEFFSFQYARRISKLTGAPIVHTYHTLYEQYVKYLIPSRRIGKCVVRVVSRKRLKRCKCVIAPTSKVEDALRSYGLRNDISIVPSGISLEQHKKRLSAEERSQKRKALGIEDHHTVLINLGRLGTEKNLGELLELYSKAIKKNGNLKFLIVGDGPAREELEELCVKLGIGEQVIFTGMVQPGEVQEYYQLGDIFVSASTSETQGLTYIEAAANGLPLLCREDLCLKDVIRQGENGYEYRNADEFLDLIDTISKNTEWREAASRRSEEIAATFDKSTFGDAVEKVYLSVIE